VCVFSQFSKAWFPLAYYVSMWGRIFNWGIISQQISIIIGKTQTPQLGVSPAFHMVSFLLNVLCACNTFPIFSLRVKIYEPLVHVYFNML
jgi:hypothetical protein